MNNETDLTLDDADDWDLPFETDEIPGINQALARYRIMAWVVGVLLVVLVMIGMPMKYLADNDAVVRTVGVAHGWLYMVLLIAAYDLARRVQWSLWWVVGIMLAGTVPFVSFFAEQRATRDVKQRIAYVRQESDAQTN